MQKIVAGLVAAALLGGCGGGGSNPFEQDAVIEDGEDPDAVSANTPVSVPAGLAGNVQSVSFDAATGTVVVEGLELDNVPVIANYRRRPSLDRPGYLAFTAQDDPLDRHFTAYVAQSNNSGAVRAGTVGSPGPRNRFFVGGFFERDGGYTPPAVSETTGLVSYAGNYVGVTNIGDRAGGDLLSVPAGTPDELRVSQSGTVTGQVFINADFADNNVEGNIFGRSIAETGQELPSLVLVSSQIAANGTFNGAVEYDVGDIRSNSNTPSNTGSYGGVFGGPDAEGIAGVVNLTGFDGVGNPLGLENELETGIFVLDQCGAAVNSPICANVNPSSGTP